MSGMPELVDRRALAWLRFVDAATGAPAGVAVSSRADGARLVRKPNGDLVVLPGAALAAHDGFDPPAAPPATTVAIDLVPTGGYAPRRLTLALPRDADPAHAGDAASLFRPVAVPLYPAASYRAGGQLAAVRVTLRHAGDQMRIEGALLRLVIGGRTAARALTDAAGEALLIADGVPITAPGPGATVVGDVEGSIDAIVDPDLARFAADPDVAAARASARARATGWIDPEELEARLAGDAAPPVQVRVRAGATATATIAWTPA